MNMNITITKEEKRKPRQVRKFATLIHFFVYQLNLNRLISISHPFFSFVGFPFLSFGSYRHFVSKVSGYTTVFGWGRNLFFVGFTDTISAP
jgi:hypothetical protein